MATVKCDKKKKKKKKKKKEIVYFHTFGHSDSRFCVWSQI